MGFELPNGYKSKTTFWEDFSIADKFGIKAIKDTYKRAFNEWKDNVEYLTELSVVLNHKIWEWYQEDDNIAQVYNDLWIKTNDYAKETLKGDNFRYYWEVTD